MRIFVDYCNEPLEIGYFIHSGGTDMDFLGVAQQDSQLSSFLRISGFGVDDLRLLQEVGPKVVPHMALVAQHFMQRLRSDPQAEQRLEAHAALVEANITQWLEQLFTGPHDATFLDAQDRVGETHVQARIPPLFTAFGMSYLRAALPQVLGSIGVAHQYPEGAVTAAVLRLLDLCQYLIDRAYYARLLQVTGISKSLLDRLMTV
jgi:hypothetical protein